MIDRRLTTLGRVSRRATPVGFTWDEYLEGLVSQNGSLTTVAERLAATRAYADEVSSIERALRRLRGRGLRLGMAVIAFGPR